jgi:zinc transporter 1/2/3
VSQQEEQQPLLNVQNVQNDEEGLVNENKLCDYIENHSHHSHHSLGGVLPVLMSITLSVHSFLFGFSIGISPNWNNVLQIIVCVCLHKFIESFALGICLVEKKVPVKNIVITGIIYVIMIPSGGALGLILAEKLSKSVLNILPSIVQSIAAGCFLYISHCELNEVFKDHPSMMSLNVISMLSGSATVCVLTIFTSG